MLDNPHQIAAYKLLQATPVNTATSITQAAFVEETALAKANTLAALLLTTVTYPSTITAQVAKLTNWIALLNRASTGAGTFKTNITPYQVPTHMVELYLGWQVYLRVNELPETTPIRTNAAVADTTVVLALKAAVEDLNLTTITTAWQTVNTALAPAAGGSGAGTGGTTPPTLTAAQIAALTSAMAAVDARYTTITMTVAAVENLAANAKTDADVAEDAFHRAVDVAVLTNIGGNSLLAESLQAIVTPAVYVELKTS